MGRMTGAAGFKRDSVPSARGVPDAASTGFSYKNQSSNRYTGGVSGITQGSSIGMNQPTDDQLSGNGLGGYNNQSSPMKSARRSFTQRMAAAAGVEVNQSIDKDITNRPPLYVPTKREPLAGDSRVGLRDSLNAGGAIKVSYQPKTSFSYVPSAEAAVQQQKP